MKNGTEKITRSYELSRSTCDIIDRINQEKGEKKTDIVAKAIRLYAEQEGIQAPHEGGSTSISRIEKAERMLAFLSREHADSNYTKAKLAKADKLIRSHEKKGEAIGDKLWHAEKSLHDIFPSRMALKVYLLGRKWAEKDV